jgi:hypothetical protein
MKCPNCQSNDPTPPASDNGTTTCPKCGHRFPIDETPSDQSSTAAGAGYGASFTAARTRAD